MTISDGELESKDLEGADELLLKWERRTTLAAMAHARSANRCSSWDVRLGSASVILTAIVGTSVFAALQRDLSTVARIAVGVLTVGAASASAVHVFAALPDRKAAYERASRRHAAIRRRIEVVRARLASRGRPEDVWETIREIEAEMNAVAASSPNAADRLWAQTRRQMKGEFNRRERVWANLRGVPLVPIGAPGTPDGPQLPEDAEGGVG